MAESTWTSSGAPASACITFGVSDFILVPLPAARTMARTGVCVMPLRSPIGPVGVQLSRGRIAGARPR